MVGRLDGMQLLKPLISEMLEQRRMTQIEVQAVAEEDTSLADPM